MMRVPTSTARAFTLVEIMIVVALIGLLAAIAIPNFMRVRAQAQRNTCVNNLRLIDAVKQQWALEWRQPASAEPTLDQLAPYLLRSSSSSFACPANAGNTNFSANYAINAVTNAPTCVIIPADHALPR